MKDEYDFSDARLFSKRSEDAKTIRFIAESNKIEGIDRPPTNVEIAEHNRFLTLPEITIPDLEQFVSVYQPGAKLRTRTGMDVRIGSRIAPVGGPQIVERLDELLDKTNSGVIKKEDESLFFLSPFKLHVQYELLHPFTDGNGRSGRVLWLWQMIEMYGDAPLGFLHQFYYQTLQAQ